MRVFLSVIFLLLLSACDLPKDPHSTFERIKEGSLRVGIASNNVWTRYRDGNASGVEAELIRMFADELGVTTEWIFAGETELMQKLSNGEVDLVIAGLLSDSPWKSRAALTQSYLKIYNSKKKEHEKHVMAVRMGENRLLLALDKFLQNHRPQVMNLFEQMQ